MNHRLQAAAVVDTRSLAPGEVVLAMPCHGPDPLEQMAAADRADWVLLRLVLCVGTATLVLALASSLAR